MAREDKLKQAADDYAEKEQYSLSLDDEGGYLGIDTVEFSNKLICFATSEAAREYWQSDVFSEELEFNIRNILSLHLNNFYQENGLSVPSKIRTNKENEIIELIKIELQQNNYIKNT